MQYSAMWLRAGGWMHHLIDRRRIVLLAWFLALLLLLLVLLVRHYPASLKDSRAWELMVGPPPLSILFDCGYHTRQI